MLPSHNRIGFKRNYFSLPHPLWIIVLLPSLTYIVVTAFAPDIIPPASGPVREFSLYLARNYPGLLYYGVIGLGVGHLLESLYALKLCRDAEMTSGATIKWFLSTSVFGFTSVLLRLKPYLQRAKRAQF